MHHPVLGVGHQPDEVLVGCDAEGERQQLVLQGVRAQCALQVIWGAVLQAEPTTHTAAEFSVGKQKNNKYCLI